MQRNFALTLFAVLLLAGCAAEYSPNTYATTAVQQANKVDAGVVIGFREVLISANGTVGAVTGGAAGGVLGSQVGASRIDQTLGGVAGSTVGSILGKTIEHVTGDTKGWEYIVRKHSGDLISVTQTEPQPLPVGQKVLVISGAQARIIVDYSIETTPPAIVTPAVDQKFEAKAKPPVIDSREEMPPTNAVAPVIDKPTVTDLPPPSPGASELPVAAPVTPDYRQNP